MKVEEIELVPPQLTTPKLDLMVETLKQLSSGSSFLSIDEHEALDSLGRSLEAHRQPGMPPGAFALFFPDGYLGLAIAAYNRVAGNKGIERANVSDIYTSARKRVPSPEDIGRIESGVVLHRPDPVSGRDPSLWHMGLPANLAVNRFWHKNSYPTDQEAASRQTIAELEKIYPGCTSGLVGTTETVVQAFMSVLSDGETPMPLNNGSMRDLNIATTDDDRPLVGCVLSEGDRLYVDCSDGRACDYAGVSFAVIKND